MIENIKGLPNFSKFLGPYREYIGQPIYTYTYILVSYLLSWIDGTFSTLSRRCYVHLQNNGLRTRNSLPLRISRGIPQIGVGPKLFVQADL